MTRFTVGLWSTVLSAILLLTPVQASAQSTSTAQPTPEQAEALRGLYERFLIALAKRDTSELSRVLAPGYTFVRASGDTILTREDRIRFAATDTSTSKVQYTLHNCSSHVHGVAAVGHCRYRATITAPKATADTVREFISTAVFAQQGGKWQILTTHISLVRPR